MERSINSSFSHSEHLSSKISNEILRSWTFWRSCKDISLQKWDSIDRFQSQKDPGKTESLIINRAIPNRQSKKTRTVIGVVRSSEIR